MNTMEITKIVGGACGALLVFLLISTAAHAIFDTHSDEVAFAVPVEESDAAEEEPVEEIDIDAIMASADPAAGETIFRRCAACHKVDGSNAVGPHLDGVVGRPIGSVGDFGYSGAMSGHGGDWTPEALYHFLQNPKNYVPGTTMSFAGLPKSEDRANLIAYLESQPN